MICRHQAESSESSDLARMLKAAALDLGVSQQTVLQKLKSGQLEGIRVHIGRRSAWRILIDSTPSKDQITLFE